MTNDEESNVGFPYKEGNAHTKWRFANHEGIFLLILMFEFLSETRESKF